MNGFLPRGEEVNPVHRLRTIGLRVALTAVLTAAALGVSACTNVTVDDVEGFWFFSYQADGGSEGVAFAYITEDGGKLGGGVASPPVGGPISGRLTESEFELTARDVSGTPVVNVEGALRRGAARASWSFRAGDAEGRLTAEPFRPADAGGDANPFLGTWNNSEDGGITTLTFGDDFRFTGSEGDLDFKGRYAFDEDRRIVGVYEADAESVHMEMLTYRFEGGDTVVLNGSTYRRQ
jgi:hypothetical protein